jgi:uncharacterized membrane protein (DUF4010 family)
MESPDQVIVRLAVAFAVGALIGIERERSKGEGPHRETAGLRTFTLISLAGAISLSLGGIPAFIAFGVVTGVLAALGYSRTRETDPGLTSEIAMIVTFLLGGLVMQQPGLAAGLGVIVTILLAARTRAHDWAKNVLTDDEVRDGLTLAAAALVILPIIPEGHVDPWGLVQPRKLWMLVVLFMAVNAMGYVALRTLGARVGLPLAGLFSGFVSSTATIGAMGTRTQKQPDLHRAAVAGAAASSVATVVQLAIVVALVHVPTLLRIVPALVAAVVAAIAYAAVFAIRSLRESQEQEPATGRPFSPKVAIVFVLIVGATLALSAVFSQWLGSAGALIAGAISGFGDAHAAAISAASLAASERVAVDVAALTALVGFTTNSISKAIVAFSLGSRRYAFELLPGLALMVLAAWGGWMLRGTFV